MAKDLHKKSFQLILKPFLRKMEAFLKLHWKPVSYPSLPSPILKKSQVQGARHHTVGKYVYSDNWLPNAWWTPGTLHSFTFLKFQIWPPCTTHKVTHGPLPWSRVCVRCWPRVNRSVAGTRTGISSTNRSFLIVRKTSTFQMIIMTNRDLLMPGPQTIQPKSVQRFRRASFLICCRQKVCKPQV